MSSFSWEGAHEHFPTLLICVVKMDWEKSHFEVVLRTHQDKPYLTSNDSRSSAMPQDGGVSGLVSRL